MPACRSRPARSRLIIGQVCPPSISVAYEGQVRGLVDGQSRRGHSRAPRRALPVGQGSGCIPMTLDVDSKRQVVGQWQSKGAASSPRLEVTGQDVVELATRSVDRERRMGGQRL